MATLTKANWRQFDSFCWHDRPDDCEEFAIVHTHHRDSDLIDVSNAHVIALALEPFPDDAIPQSFGHFACGWIDGYAIRVGSEAERVYLELMARCDDYPILDDEHYSKLESDAQSEAWDNWAAHEFQSGLESAFGFDVDMSGEQAFELFRKLSDRSNTYWITESSSVSIDIARIVNAATLDDIREYVPAQGLRVYLSGTWFANGMYHAGDVLGPCNYADVFEQIQSAIDDGADHVGLFTWDIE